MLAALALAVVLAVPGRADEAGSSAELIARAEKDLDRGDGLAAEIRLRQAMAQGASRKAVVVLMGEALADQGKAEGARGWLKPEEFAPRSAARGWRNLGRLERKAGNLMASAHAYDNALRAAPRDAGIWVEVAYLRFALGNHADGVDAGNRALELDPANVRALEFKGNLVRDQYGLVAALPWYEAALKSAPDDLAVLGEYAATLGELGRAGDMLVVTRHMLKIDGRSARAFYLQAVLAARAGNIRLARSMLARGGKGLETVPGAMLLSATLDLAADNPQAALVTLERLVDRQPGNARAQDLLARALFAAGNHGQVIARFGVAAEDRAASPWLMTLVARALEVTGDRARAAPLLDRAARDYSRPIMPVAANPVGAMLRAGQGDAARAVATRAVSANPADAAARAIAGDVAMAQGRAADAVAEYRKAAAVRMSEAMLVKLSVALEVAGRGGEAARLVDGYLAQSPSSRVAVWLTASVARRQKDWGRAAALLTYLRDHGGQGDVNATLALAEAQLRSGDAAAAAATAGPAYDSQRASGHAAGVLAAALKGGGDAGSARALLAKSRKLGADYASLPPVRYAFAKSD